MIFLVSAPLEFTCRMSGKEENNVWNAKTTKLAEGMSEMEEELVMFARKTTAAMWLICHKILIFCTFIR